MITKYDWYSTAELIDIAENSDDPFIRELHKRYVQLQEELGDANMEIDNILHLKEEAEEAQDELETVQWEIDELQGRYDKLKERWNTFAVLSDGQKEE